MGRGSGRSENPREGGRLTSPLHTDYLQSVYHPSTFKRTVEYAAKRLEALPRVHALAFSGHSGAAMAYPLAYLTGYPLICVRKSSTKDHFQNAKGRVEGAFLHPELTYYIVDDFISGGNTVLDIIQTIETVRRRNLPGNTGTDCKGFLLYNEEKDWEKYIYELSRAFPVYGCLQVTPRLSRLPLFEEPPKGPLHDWVGKHQYAQDWGIK